MSDERLLLRVSEACKMLSVSRATMYELVKDGTVPSIQLGKEIRIPVEALRKWVEDQSKGATGI